MSCGVLLAVGDVGFEAVLLDAFDGRLFHVVRRCVDVPDLLTAAASHQAQVAVVSASLRNLDRTVLTRLRDEGVAVIGATAESSSADEAALRRLGVIRFAAADDPVSIPDIATAAISGPSDAGVDVDTESSGDAGGQVGPDGSASLNGDVIAVWGGAGAPGRTVVSLGVGAVLAQLGAETMVVDADVYGGACAASLGLVDESSGLLAATRAANVGSLDVASLARCARTVSPHMRVLTGLPRADRWTELKPALLVDVLHLARRLCAFTVIDCGFTLETDEEISYDLWAPRRNGATIAALQNADTVVVVGAADPLGLSRLVRAVHDLSVVVPGVSPYVVLNRVRDSLGWSEADIMRTVARATGVATLRALPEDRIACDKAILHGRTLTEVAPEARLTLALGRIAAELAGVPEPVRRRRRLVRR